jgi:thiol-disulfide isomerase/thioredoxin
VLIRRVVCLAIAATALAACAPDSPDTSHDGGGPAVGVTATTSTPTPAVKSTSTRVERTKSPSAEVPAALRFTGTTVEGKRFEGSSLAGKPLLLWFWAPWCPVCRGQISQVEKIASDHKGALSVVGVGSLDSAGAIRGFAQDVTGVTHLLDESGAVWKHFRVKQQSSFVLLDASGTKVFSSGYGGSKELDDRVADVVR